MDKMDFRDRDSRNYLLKYLNNPKGNYIITYLTY